MCVFHPMNMVPLEGNICRHASMHSLIQQKMYWVPNMCQVLSVTGISEKNVRYTLNLLSQLVINIQCHSSGLRVLLAASFSYIPISLADCIVIFDPVLNLYYIFYWFPSINILNIFLSFLLPPLLYFFFSWQLFFLCILSWPLIFCFYSFGWYSASWDFLQLSHGLYKPPSFLTIRSG